MDTDNFIVHVKTEDIFEDVTKKLKTGLILQIVS